MSYYISKFKNIDIKTHGSKNYGASNTVLLIGKRAGLLVFVHDFLKSFLAVIIAGLLFGYRCGLLAGCAAVLGHIFPFYLKFDGGKGFASFIGLSFAIAPVFSLFAFPLSLIVAIIGDYIVLSTFSLIITLPIYLIFTQHIIEAVCVILITIIIFYKHKANIINLTTKNGKESKIRETLFKKKSC